MILCDLRARLRQGELLELRWNDAILSEASCASPIRTVPSGTTRNETGADGSREADATPNGHLMATRPGKEEE